MNLDEKVIKYGVVGGIRYNEPDKQNFLNNISEEFAELGYEVKILKKDLKRFSGINCYIGDVVNADHLIIANYDTPMDSLNKNMKYFPFNHKATNRELSEKSKYYAAAVVMTGAVIMFLVTMFLNLSPMVHKIFLLVVTAVMTGIAYLFIKGIPNKANANLNTSGVLGILEIAKSKPKNTAFILTDRAYIDNLGDVMVQEALPKSLDKKKIIYLSAIGRGDHTVISYKENNAMQAKAIARASKNIDLFQLDEVGLEKNPLGFYKNAVMVTVCDSFNDVYEISDVCNENDVRLNEQAFQKVVNMIINYLK